MSDQLYLVLARFAMDDVPVGLFHSLSEAEQCVAQMENNPGDAVHIAFRLFDLQPTADDGYPFPVIIEFQRGYPVACVASHPWSTDSFKESIEKAWNGRGKGDK